MEVSEFTVKPAAAVPPNSTAVAPVKPLPLIVTEVPPLLLPEEVPRPVTLGAAGVRYVKVSELPVLEVPLLVVTCTSTLPAAPAGATADISESLRMVKLVAAVPPKATAVAPEKFVPEIRTAWPPAVLPVLGLTEVTLGAGAVTLV
jgi:hypothetical protein